METILFLLCTDLSTREDMWNLFIAYTLLINQLIQAVVENEEFEIWREQGKLSRKNVKQLSEKIIKDKYFIGLPSRVHTSAVLSVLYTFNSWFEVQKKLRLKINGKEEWLRTIEADIVLSQSTDFSPELIQARAREILSQVEEEAVENQQQNNFCSIMSLIFNQLRVVETTLDQRGLSTSSKIPARLIQRKKIQNNLRCDWREKQLRLKGLKNASTVDCRKVETL